jgi:hypothetical protein
MQAAGDGAAAPDGLAVTTARLDARSGAQGAAPHGAAPLARAGVSFDYGQRSLTVTGGASAFVPRRVRSLIGGLK